MKKLDELKFLLASVLVINQTNEHKDNDISLILDYAFRRLYGANTNLFLLAEYCLSFSSATRVASLGSQPIADKFSPFAPHGFNRVTRLIKTA